MKKRLYIQNRHKTAANWHKYNFCPYCEAKAVVLLNEVGIRFKQAGKGKGQLMVQGKNKWQLDQLFAANNIGD